MKARVAAPVILGGLLVVLVATAAVIVAWLLWTRSVDRERDHNGRAAEAVSQALENSVGRTLTSLRAAAGLVDANGEVDRASFDAYARAVSSIGATDGLALATIVPGDRRARFESETGTRISELARPKVLRNAARRASYVPIVAVWPEVGDRTTLQGFDLTSEPVRRSALQRARATRRTVLTRDTPFVLGGRGFQAFRPIYAPTQEAGAPVAFVSAWFSREMIANAFSRLPTDVRARVRMGDTELFATKEPPSSGATRSISLGGRTFVLTARGEPVSRSSSSAILLGGAVLALMLATFTWARISSERRLVRAHDAERAARERSELLEQIASRLAIAETAHDVATATVAELAASGLDLAALYLRGDASAERLAAHGSQPDLDVADAAATEAMVAGVTVQVPESKDAGDDGLTASGTDDLRLRSLLAVPLFDAKRACVGALVAGSHTGWLVSDMQPVVVGVAEQCVVALERARLRSLDDEVRRRTDILQRLAASLSGAALPTEVAEASVPYLFEAFGAGLVALGVAGSDDVRTLKVPRGLAPEEWRWRPVPRSTSTPTADAMRERRTIELHGRDRVQEVYPPELEQLLAGVASMLVVPFPRATGAVGVAFHDDRALTADERRMLAEIAEELTGALERATLLERERDARMHAELLERHAARLAAATTETEVASATVSEIEAVGADVVFAWTLGDGEQLETLASSSVPDETRHRFGVYPLDVPGLVSDAMKARSLVAVGSGDEYDARYPELAKERRRLGAESLVALPLRNARGEVIGAISATSRRENWVTGERRPLLLGIAEQTGVALERARLQTDAERAAEDSSFLALFGESLERATTVEGRARRIVEELIDRRATFAAVHLVDEEGVVAEVASGGSRPTELDDDEVWAAWVERVVAGGREVRPPMPESSPVDPRVPSLVVLPLRARGRSLGALTLRAAPGPNWKPVIAGAVAREIAGRAALALDNALAYEKERDVSHALQLGLLGGALPEFENVVVSPAYRAGTAALEVGGDWYDAFPLLSGSVALVVGDVVGHGLEAAVAMGQLRGAVSALAQTSSPAELLDRLDAFVETVPSAATATLAFVDLDSATGELRYACAGHPPPLVVSPRGSARFLWDGRSAPLGSMLGDSRAEAVDYLDEGETLVLYTDGLVERRSETIDVGLERLADVARLGALGAPTLADEICDALIEGRAQDDDVCVLTIHRIPNDVMFSRSFRAAPSELAGLREALREWLVERGAGDDVGRGVVLAVSEAATNAVEHAYGCDGAGIVTVMARLVGDRLDITVRDEGRWREGGSDADRGRGLAIMRAIVDEVTIERDDAGTVVRMLQGAHELASA